MKRNGKRKYKATLQYLGSRYHGWQIQPGQLTVQGLLQDLLTSLAKRPIQIIAASRTDAGVHALGQVVHFTFPPKRTIPNLQTTLNALLPPDIRVRRLEGVPWGFHAQKDAQKKQYRYLIFNGTVLPPQLYGRVCHVVHPLDFAAMSEAAECFLGRHDFSGFAASSTTVKNRTRTILCSTLIKKGRNITYRVEANGFLHHMVRNIVGTLLEVGLGKNTPSWISEILASGDRREAGATAPPEGLYLVRIWY